VITHLKLGINPKLISIITGKAFSEVEPNLGIEWLPSNYAQGIANYMKSSVDYSKVLCYKLTCTQCGHSDNYDLGMIAYYSEEQSKNELQEAIQAKTDKKELSLPSNLQFGGYFRCYHCNAAGLWKISHDTLCKLAIDVMEGIMSTPPKIDAFNRPKVMYGKMVSEDGHYYTWVTDYEEQSLKRLSQNPTDAMTWHRLANVYFWGGRPDLGAVAYEKSIQFDSKHMESHFSLGQILLGNGARDAGIRHLRITLMTAHTYTYILPVYMRDLLVKTLSILIEEAENDEQFVEWLPLREEIEAYCGGVYDLSRIPGKMSELIIDINTEDKTSLIPIAEMYMGKLSEKLLAKERSNKLTMSVLHPKKKKPSKKPKQKKAQKK
jgi:hypothetical protein